MKKLYKPVFWALLFLALVSFVFCLKANFYSSNIDSFGSVLENSIINLSFKNKAQPNYIICYNGICKSPAVNPFYVTHYLQYTPEKFSKDFYEGTLDKIFIGYQKEDRSLEDNLEDIYLFVGNRDYHYSASQIKAFEKKEFKMQLDNSSKTLDFSALVIPNEYQTNYKGKLNHFCILFLSLFYNWRLFVFPYLCLFLAFVVRVFDKNKSLELSSKLHFGALISIFILAIVLRLNLLMYYPFWPDEIYTKLIATHDFISCFKDAGNPPLFFLLEFFVSKVFPNSDVALKAFAFLIGALFSPAVYILFRDINKNLALFASFFAAINTLNIFHCQEIRSYGLCMLLVVLNIYFLFKYLENPNKKSLIAYSICTILTINTNWWLAIFAFCNWVWCVFDLLIQKRKLEALKSTIANVICAATFLPYLLLTYKTALSSDFNGWIGEFGLEKFALSIWDFFVNRYAFFFLVIIAALNLIVCLFAKKINLKINPQKKKLFLYLIYAIVSVLLVVSLISIFIKPIFHKRLLVSIYSLFMLLEILSISTVFDIEKFKKKTYIIFSVYSILMFSFVIRITQPLPDNRLIELQEYINFIAQDAPKYLKSGYEVVGVMTDDFRCLNYYPQIKGLDIKWHMIDGNKGEYAEKIIKEDFTKAPKAVVYLNSIGVHYMAILTNKRARKIHSNAMTNVKIIYD